MARGLLALTCYAQREGPMSHLKHALRQLRLRPGLSFIVIVMLALGIGATTAMFSLYHQILVRPLPVPEPERLVNLAAPGPGKIGGTYGDLGIGDREAQFSYPMFRELEARQTGFTGLAAHTDFVSNLSYREQPSYSRGGTHGVRQLLRRAEPAAGAGKAHRARGRAAGRRVGRGRSRVTTTGSAAFPATRTCSASC